MEVRKPRLSVSLEIKAIQHYLRKSVCRLFYFDGDIVSILFLLNICVLRENSVADYLILILCLFDPDIWGYMCMSVCVLNIYIFIKNMCRHVSVLDVALF